MIPYLVFILLGISQGILEWLPVSSEGQILFIGTLFDIEQSLLLSVAFWLHFGTMLSVLFLFKEEWRQIIKLDNLEYAPVRRFLLISTIGTAVIGIPIKLLFLELFNAENLSVIIMVVLGIALFLTAFLLKYQKSHLGEHSISLDDISDRGSFLVGLAQGISIIPGVSRSGSTVTALILLNVKSEDSFRGSFFMSVPAVLGAITLDLFDYIRGVSDSIIVSQPLGIGTAIIVSAIIGYFTMKYLIEIARKYDFSNIVLALAILVFIYLIFI